MYRWLVFAHVLAIFVFLIAHGASAAVIFKLRAERQVERIRVLLDLSQGANSVANAALLVLLAAGIAAGFMGGWWGHYWIWTSLGLLILISIGMLAFGSGPLVRIRQLVQPDEPGRSNRKTRQSPTVPSTVSTVSTVSEQQLAALLADTRPVLVTVIGGGGLALILWLMLFKPF